MAKKTQIGTRGGDPRWGTAAQGKLLGTLTPFTAAQLGQIAAKAAIQRSGADPDHFDEVIVGQVVRRAAARPSRARFRWLPGCLRTSVAGHQ